MSIDYSGLAGGIGKGLMMGSQFVAQRNDAKDRKAYQDEVLGMQQQTHDARMQQFGWQADEKKRQDTIQGIYTEAFNNPDLTDDWERSEYFATKALPHFKPHEVEEMRVKNEQLRQRFTT